jgi:hypothetical protein
MISLPLPGSTAAPYQTSPLRTGSVAFFVKAARNEPKRSPEGSIVAG